MRRTVPWALVGLLAVVGLVGALSGVANHASGPEGQLNVSAIVAATRSARTARFSYSTITTSSNPLLRSTSYGRGTVDFETESLATVEDDRQTDLSGSGSGPLQPTTQTTQFSQIFIGKTSYNEFDAVGVGADDGWTKSDNFPVSSFGSFGVLSLVGPVSSLAAGASAPGQTTEDLGADLVGKTLTTRYRLLVPMCSVTETGAPRAVVSPTDLWIDTRGRLVQVRNVSRITQPRSFKLPKDIPRGVPGFTAKSQRLLAGQSTSVSTIRLFDFGARVSITAPKTVYSGSGTAIALTTHARRGCVPSTQGWSPT